MGQVLQRNIDLRAKLCGSRTRASACKLCGSRIRSRCKKDGSDRLYGERTAVEIDYDVRDEYWTEIRSASERRRERVANR